jgi:hypothetical protein
VTRNQARVLIGVAFTLLALGFLWVGSEVRDNSFWSSVWVNVGTACLLVIPAIVVEQIFERRITEAEDAVDSHVDRRLTEAQDAVDERLDEVAATVGDVSSRLNKLQQGVIEAVDLDRKDEYDTAVRPGDAIGSGEWEAVHDALVHARDTRTTTPGVFVPVPEKQLALRFEALSSGSESAVLVTVVPDDEPEPPRVEDRWSANEPVDDLFRRLDAKLRRKYGLSNAPNLAEALSTVFTTLMNTLRKAQERRLNLPDADQKSPAIELATVNWLVTTDGLEKVGDPSKRFTARDVINARRQSERGMPSPADPHDDDLAHALAIAYRRIVTELTEFPPP